jgi:hypothetical protein
MDKVERDEIMFGWVKYQWGADHPSGVPYNNVWRILPPNPWFNLQINCFNRKDTDPWEHDHPGQSISLCLWGKARETGEIDGKRFDRVIGPGRIVHRPARFIHQVNPLTKHFITFIAMFGPWQSWGFYTDKGRIDYIEAGKIRRERWKKETKMESHS